ncbi:MAG: hypothetical protein WAM46_10650, partial [Flavobacterium sp.]
VRPLKVYKKECAMEYEIKLDFEKFYNSDEKDRKDIIVGTLSDQSINIFKGEKIKDFNSEKYIMDLINCLNKFKLI